MNNRAWRLYDTTSHGGEVFDWLFVFLLTWQMCAADGKITNIGEKGDHPWRKKDSRCRFTCRPSTREKTVPLNDSN